MTDTAPVMAAEYRRRLLARTPGERVVMACDMFDTARAFARAGILRHGPIPESQLRCQLFLRFYGREFSARERAKVFERLGTS